MKYEEREQERERGGKRGKREIVGFLCYGGLFVKAVLRATGLAPGSGTVTGNYTQAECVTCPSAVAESLGGGRAHASCPAACRSLCLVTHSAALWCRKQH